MKKLMNKLAVKAMMAKENFKNMLNEERGDTNFIAIILILAIVVVLAVLFKDKIVSLFNSIWGDMVGNTSGINTKV